MAHVDADTITDEQIRELRDDWETPETNAEYREIAGTASLALSRMRSPEGRAAIAAARARCAEILNARAKDGVLDHCFFCKGKWGACTCEAVEGDGFEFDEFQITDPGVSVCGRFYVNPEIYYGDAYKRWAAKE